MPRMQVLECGASVSKSEQKAVESKQEEASEVKRRRKR